MSDLNGSFIYLIIYWSSLKNRWLQHTVLWAKLDHVEEILGFDVFNITSSVFFTHGAALIPLIKADFSRLPLNSKPYSG